MLIACWSPKGGSGTTVVAAALGLVLAEGRGTPHGALLADLAADVPAALGLPEPAGPGLADWLAAETDVPDDALEHLEIEAGPHLRLLPAGATRLAPRFVHPTPPSGVVATILPSAERCRTLAEALGSDRRPVVADCGVAADGAGLTVAAAAAASLVVLRPCYLALRRALAAPIRPSGVVLVDEPDRALGGRDIAEVLDAPILAVVPVEAAVTRAVDAGLLGHRLPRHLAAAMHGLAAALRLAPDQPGRLRRLPSPAGRGERSAP